MCIVPYRQVVLQEPPCCPFDSRVPLKPRGIKSANTCNMENSEHAQRVPFGHQLHTVLIKLPPASLHFKWHFFARLHFFYYFNTLSSLQPGGFLASTSFQTCLSFSSCLCSLALPSQPRYLSHHELLTPQPVASFFYSRFQALRWQLLYSPTMSSHQTPPQEQEKTITINVTAPRPLSRRKDATGRTQVKVMAPTTVLWPRVKVQEMGHLQKNTIIITIAQARPLEPNQARAARR